MPGKPVVIPASAAGAGRREEAWGALTWLVGEPAGRPAGLTLGRVVIRRGRSNPRHAHGNCTEILHLLAGTLRHRTGDLAGELAPGDTLVVPPGVFHEAASVGEVDAEMIVAYDSDERDFTPAGRR